MAIVSYLAGTTLAFGTQVTLTAALITLKLGGTNTKEIATTTLASILETTVSSPVKIAEDLTAVLIYDPTINYTAAVGQADETITITLPKLVPASTNGRRISFVGHITKVGLPEASVDGRPQIDVVIKRNSVFTELVEA